MRKIETSGKRQKYDKKKQMRIHKKQMRAANRERVRKQNRKKIFLKRQKDPLSIFYSRRSNLRHNLYKKTRYKGPAETIEIAGEFGLEHNIANFLEMADSFMSKKSRFFLFDFDECARIWPTAITLLCSFAQWIELTSFPNQRPRVGSTNPKSDKVSSYLNHCGFYDYVVREKADVPNYYSKDEIVKIRRERKQSNLYLREEEIVDLLSKHSQLSEDQIELFNDVILTEIFNNVSEHGINYKDEGWWTLSQYHKSTGIISICIADNGIGIKNNLSTGPQGQAIVKKLGNSGNNDGHYLRIAIEENVSGAMNASIKTGLIIPKHERGSRRGNGLKRVLNACKKLHLSIVILSQKGYLVIDRNGSLTDSGSKSNRVFAGTLYHLQIPAKKDVGNDNKSAIN